MRWGWLLAAGPVLQGVAGAVVSRGDDELLRAILIAVSYAVLVIGVAANLRYLGFRLLLIGLTLNFVAIGANGWRMPIDLDALARTGYHQPAALPGDASMDTPKHTVVARSDIALWPLADIIAIAPAKRVISVGDSFVYVGAAVTIAGIIRRSRRRDAVPAVEAVSGSSEQAASVLGGGTRAGGAREGPASVG